MDIQVIIKIILGILLLVCGIIDGKTRHIPIYLVAGVFALLMIIVPFNGAVSLPSAGGGILIGVILLAVSKISQGQIGKGDGILFIVTGLGLGFWINLSLLVYSLSVAAIFSFAVLFCKKKGKKHSFPFVPFICIGYLGVILL